MSFNTDLVRQALYAAFSNMNVGDTLSFPATDPVFTNGATLASAPSATNISGITVATYQMNGAYLFMKYAFTVPTLAYVGILDNDSFKDKVKYYFQNEYQNYITSVLPTDTIFKSPSLDELLFNVNEVNGVRICTVATYIKYWTKLP